jgi:hypothetical protein
MNNIFGASTQRKPVCFFLFFFWAMIGTTTLSFAQQAISWDVMADVSYDEQYDKELNVVWLIPNFGRQPKALRGKVVTIEGFFIPLDIENRFFVLSKNPYSACFFCGGAGPETVIELDIDADRVKRLRMDQKVRFQGKLQLNRTDFDHLNYILADAKFISSNP